jgi:hypothetical protein
VASREAGPEHTRVQTQISFYRTFFVFLIGITVGLSYMGILKNNVFTRATVVDPQGSFQNSKGDTHL